MRPGDRARNQKLNEVREKERAAGSKPLTYKLKLKLIEYIMNNILSKIPNWRELLIAILSAVIIAVGDQIGLSESAKEIVGFLAGSYVTGGMVASINIKKRVETVKRQLLSKKFLFTLVTIVVTTLGQHIGIDPTWAIGILGGLLNVGTGVADALVEPDETPPAK